MNIANITTKLPSKPSALIKLALKDLRKIEQNPRYEINMNRWHRGSKRRCEVCLAGAVMTCTLGVPKSRDLGPSDFEVCFSDRDLEVKLLALESFRKGEIEGGCQYLKVSTLLRDRYIPSYICSRNGFFKAMKQLADDLVGENN